MSSIQTLEPDRLYSVSEAITRLNISRSSFYNLFSAGKIKSIKIGAKRGVTGAEILRILAGGA